MYCAKERMNGAWQTVVVPKSLATAAAAAAADVFSRRVVLCVWDGRATQGGRGG